MVFQIVYVFNFKRYEALGPITESDKNTSGNAQSPANNMHHDSAAYCVSIDSKSLFFIIIITVKHR